MNIIKLISLLVLLTLTLLAIFPVWGEGEIPPPPPAKLCFEMNFERTGVLRAEAGVLREDVRCRLITENSRYFSWYGRALTIPANIGIQSVIDQGVTQAVDVFSGNGLTQFPEGVTVCLKGSGPLLFAQADSTPRQAVQAPAFGVSEWAGFRCALLFEPGLLVMTRLPKGVAAERISVIRTLTRPCHATTTYRLRLRSGPSITSETLAVIPFQTELEADRQSGDWYRVQFEGGVAGGYGWVKGRYLDFKETCE